jgi:hypothetical protein
MLVSVVHVEMKKSELKSVFSVRDDFGQWDEKNQRPELFDLLNGKKMDKTCVFSFQTGQN